MERQTYALKLAYDGARFRGWQRQPGLPTLQQAVEDALNTVLSRRLLVHGASRTDAGVDALGQVVHFQSRPGLDVTALPAQLNAHLPGEVGVLVAALASPSFHARSSSIGKRYRYRFGWGGAVPAKAFHLGASAAPDWERARAALRGLDGLPALTGLASPSRDRKPAPPLTSWELGTRAAGEAVLAVEGPAFRKHEIRNLAGHLAAVALGLASPESLRELARRERPWMGAQAPAHGLTLVEVLYPRELDPFAAIGDLAASRN